jgi:hypothetical protein
VEIEQDRAAGLLVEIFQSPDQDEIAQEVEEPLREIAHQIEENNFSFRRSRRWFR